MCLAILLWIIAHKQRTLIEEEIRNLLQELSDQSDEGSDNDLYETDEPGNLSMQEDMSMQIFLIQNKKLYHRHVTS